MDFAHGEAFIGDTGYDADRIVHEAQARDLIPVISCNPTRERKRRLDRKLFAIRYLVECFFHRLKAFRAIATRYEKSRRNYLALIHVACAWLWIN